MNASSTNLSLNYYSLPLKQIPNLMGGIHNIQTKVSTTVQQIENMKAPLQSGSPLNPYIKRELSNGRVKEIVNKYENILQSNYVTQVKTNLEGNNQKVFEEKLKKSPDILKKIELFPSSPASNFFRQPKTLEEISKNKNSEFIVKPFKTPSTELASPQAKRIKKISKKYLDIDQSKALQTAEDQELSYVKQIEKFGQQEGKYHRIQLYRFLLKPQQEQFRQDFLVAAPWMSFFDKAKNKKPLLVQQMVQIYSDPSCSLEQKKVILQFAQDVVSRGFFEKRMLQKLLCIAELEIENDLHLNEELTQLVTALKRAQPKVELARKIKYEMNHPEPETLAKQWKRVAKGKIKISKKDRNFIQDFAQDLATLSANSLKMIHQVEFYRQAWAKPELQGNAPNIQYFIHFFNQIHAFVLQKILEAENQKERHHLYLAFVKITQCLIKTHHDYSSAMAIVSALGSPILTQIVSEKVAQSVFPLEEFFSSRGNYKELRAAIENCQTMAIPCVPYFGLFLSDFTFMDDGNSDRIGKKEMINLEKMELAAKIHHKLEHFQNQLEKRQNLQYNLIQTLIEGQFLSHEKAWERNKQLKSLSKRTTQSFLHFKVGS
jgi:hypothetical protein